jgi:hypothetical protein
MGLLSLSAGVAPELALATREARVISPAADPATLLDHFMRIRSAPDADAVRWVYSGVLVVKPEGELARAVLRIEGMSRTRAKRIAKGVWNWQLDEAGYYCDLQTGAVLDRWMNPFTGKEVQPKHYRSPQRLRFDGSRILPADPLPANIDFRGEVTELANIGGLRAFTEDLYVRLPGRVSAEGSLRSSDRVSTSLATFLVTNEELGKPASSWIDCPFIYTTLNSFVGWLGMEGIAGVQNMRLVGRKCRIDDRAVISEALYARLVSDHADLLEP